MTSPESYVADLASEAVRQISARAVHILQRAPGAHSRSSLLKNCWDELCVQIQGERSVFWEAYEEDLYRLLHIEAEKLHPLELRAVWLQTSAGSEWAFATSNDGRALVYDLNDVVEYLLAAVYSEAADCTSVMR
jgi:hypothetical protein